MSKIAEINGVSIKSGDIVKIKWKPLNEILEFYKNESITPSVFLRESCLDYHVAAITSDNYYYVSGVHSSKDYKRLPQEEALKNSSCDKMPDEVKIINHYHEDGDDFMFNEHFIESISVEHDAAETYFSPKFNISLIKIDGALFVNGELVTKKDSKLIDILESTISDLAIQKMLESSNNKEG